VSQLFSTDDNCGGCAKWQPDMTNTVGWCPVLKMQTVRTSACSDGYVARQVDEIKR